MPSLQVTMPDGTTVHHRVEDSPYRIGRHVDNHVVLRDPAISKHHCELVNQATRWVLKDLGSANGTSVNGIRAADTVLAPGDTVVMGPFRLVFQDEARGNAAPVDEDATWVGGQNPAASPQRAQPVAMLGPGGMAPQPQAPAMPAVVLEVEVGPRAGQRVALPRSGLVLGGSPGADIVLDDPFASRRHARLDWNGTDFRLVDLGSTNGILMEGIATREALLRDGGRFQLGGTLIRFVWPGGPPAGGASAILAPLQPGPPAGGAPAVAPTSAAGTLPLPALPSVGPDGRRRVRILGLTFTPIMVVMLAFCGLLVAAGVGAGIVRAVAPYLKQEEAVDSTAVLAAARQAYDNAQWADAERLLAMVTPADPHAGDAELMKANIAVERENQKRLEVIAMLLEQGVPDKAQQRFNEIPATSRYFTPAREAVSKWLDGEANKAVERGRAALQVDDVEGARLALADATRLNPEVAGLAELLNQVEARDQTLQTTGRPGSLVGLVGRGRARPSAAAAPRPPQVEGVRRQYLTGDVSGARTALETLMKQPDPALVAEAQALEGAIDRVERNLENGTAALGKGDLETADGRLHEAMAGLQVLDPEGRSPRAQVVRSRRADERAAAGQRALQAGDFPAANKALLEARRLDTGNGKVEAALKQLESKAQEIYARGYVAQKDGTAQRLEEAAQWYRQVLTIAPQGDGFQYFAKATARLRELEGGEHP